MSDRISRKEFQRAIDSTLSGLQGNPYLYQRVSARAQEGEKKVKKKVSAGLIVMIILLLITLSAAAAALLSGREVVEQFALPLARGNDTDTRIEGEFSYDELLQLLEAANENGITLDEGTGLMRAIRQGQGYWEDEAIMDICRKAFGGLFYEWTIEEQHWYQEIMNQMNNMDENPYCLPGEDDMPSKEARALAVKTLRAEYGNDLPLDDPARYRREETFGRDFDEEEPIWQFVFVPRDIYSGQYFISFDRKGELLDMDGSEITWEAGTYSVNTLEDAIDRAYTLQGMSDWPQEAWHELEKLLPGADRAQGWGPQWDAHLMSRYPLPEDGELTREQAVEIARREITDDMAITCAVLLGGTDGNVWRVTAVSLAGDPVFIAKNDHVSWDIDSRTGEILRCSPWEKGTDSWCAYVKDDVYQKVNEGRMTLREAVKLAADTLRRELQDDTVPFEDPQYFVTDYLKTSRFWTITFRTQTMQYGNASVRISQEDGDATVVKLPQPLTGDTLFARYQELYGSAGGWEQALWQQFEADLASYEPLTFDARMLKTAHYPDLSAAKITRQQAVDIANLDLNWTKEEALSAVLLDAEPNPVWKIMLIGRVDEILYEVDAVTGDILDREHFKPDNYEFDSPIKRFTLRRVYAPAYIGEYGIADAALKELTKEFGDMLLDDPVLIEDQEAYDVITEGRTVTFRAKTPEIGPSYRAVFGPDGLPEKLEKLD